MHTDPMLALARTRIDDLHREAAQRRLVHRFPSAGSSTGSTVLPRRGRVLAGLRSSGAPRVEGWLAAIAGTWTRSSARGDSCQPSCCPA